MFWAIQLITQLEPLSRQKWAKVNYAYDHHLQWGDKIKETKTSQTLEDISEAPNEKPKQETKYSTLFFNKDTNTGINNHSAKNNIS